MSQKVTRKLQNAATSDEKEKRQTDSPSKEMKKKIAANAEKEKQQVAEKDKPEKVDKNADKSDKSAEKAEKAKKDEKAEKRVEKADSKVEKKVDKVDSKVEKSDKVEKKSDKPADKKVEKPAEKKTEQTEKKDDGKVEKNGKDKPKPSKQNGVDTNGEGNGTGSGDSDGDSLMIDDDAMFPELSYDDTSDCDHDDAHSRSHTRRSQVKATKTPETPRPASDKDNDDSKESKVLKLSDIPPPSDRKLRSSDSPKPDKKALEQKVAQEKREGEGDGEKKEGDKKEKDVEIIIDVDAIETETRGKTRARVSPYTRQPKLDQTITSVMANYTGNNTTMEMDITESSISVAEEATEDSSFLRGIRDIKGRASYRPHAHSLHQLLQEHMKRQSSPQTSEPVSRPTGTVVGRKRKPSPECGEPADLRPPAPHAPHAPPAHKRMRLLDRITGSLRRSLPRRNAEIVGINTDLPLTAPVASASTFDPESLKPDSLPTLPTQPTLPPNVPTLSPTPTPTQDKRCIVM